MIEVRIPKLGLTMENAVLAAWQTADGAPVRKDDILLTIETDKLTFDVPAPTDGILVRIAPEGTLCAVEEAVAWLAETSEEYQRLCKQKDSRKPMTSSETAALASENRPAAAQQHAEKRIKASPLARVMAAEGGLDLKAITGSGPGGRIVRADILRAAQAPAPPSGRQPHGDPNPVLRRIPITGARRRIFENMRKSLSDSAQFSLHTEACATALLDLRQHLNGEGQQISYNAMLIKITAAALKKHMDINASVVWGNEILVWEHINIGLAMHIDGTLMVPVFRAPHTKNLRQINTQINTFMRRIKQNRLTPDELSGGTFTITNLGFADIDHFTPIVKPPESAVLGVGRIVEKAVASKGKIVPELRVGLSLTVDHRIIDGAPAARFLHTIKQMVENPKLLI